MAYTKAPDLTAFFVAAGFKTDDIIQIASGIRRLAIKNPDKVSNAVGWLLSNKVQLERLLAAYELDQAARRARRLRE